MIGNKIKQRRKELGMTQEELANKTNCGNKATVCRYENGTRELSTTMLKVFADALGVEPNYFYNFEGDNVDWQKEYCELNEKYENLYDDYIELEAALRHIKDYLQEYDLSEE